MWLAIITLIYTQLLVTSQKGKKSYPIGTITIEAEMSNTNTATVDVCMKSGVSFVLEGSAPAHRYSASFTTHT